MKALVALLLTASLSGCLGITTTEVPATGYTADELDAWFEVSREVRFSLANFTGDSLILQVVPPAGFDVTARFQASLVIQQPAAAGGVVVEDGSPEPCLSYFSPFYRYVSFSGVRQPMVELSGPGPELNVRAPSYDITYQPSFDHSIQSYADGHPVAVALALGDVAGWKDRGDLDLRLQAPMPFHWRILEGGSLDCHPVAIEHPGGVGADAGVVTVLQDKEHRFTADLETLTTLYVGGTGSYRVTLEGPDAYFEEFTSDVGASSFSYGTGFFQPGDYRLWIERFVSAQDPSAQVVFPSGVFVMHHHMPAWVVLPPWEVPPIDLA